MNEVIVHLIAMRCELAKYTQAQIERKAKSRNKWVRAAIANRDDVPVSTLKNLALDPEPIVVRQAAWNSLLDAVTLDEVARKYKPFRLGSDDQRFMANEILYAVAENESVSAKTLWSVRYDIQKPDRKVLKYHLEKFSLAEIKDLASSLGVNEELLDVADADEIIDYLLTL